MRPLIKTLRGAEPAERDVQPPTARRRWREAALAAMAVDALRRGRTPIDRALLSQQVGLAQRIVAEKPDSAVAALRQMLAEPARRRRPQP